MKNLSKLRRAANLTQQDLANITGYSRRQVQRFEAGHRMSKITTWYFKSVLVKS